MTGAPWLQLSLLDVRVLRATGRVSRADCGARRADGGLLGGGGPPITEASARQADDRARWPPSVRLASHPPR